MGVEELRQRLELLEENSNKLKAKLSFLINRSTVLKYKIRTKQPLK